MTTWKPDEIRRFFALDDVKVYRDRVVWWVAVNTGLRRGECSGCAGEMLTSTRSG